MEKNVDNRAGRTIYQAIGCAELVWVVGLDRRVYRLEWEGIIHKGLGGCWRRVGLDRRVYILEGEGIIHKGLGDAGVG